MENIFTSVEFYVITITVAIILFGFIFHPSKKGEAFTYFFSGQLTPADITDPSETLTIEAQEDGKVKFTHTSITLADDSKLNVALTISDDDIKITEKIDTSNCSEYSLVNIYNFVFYVDCMRAKRYHIYYESTSTESWAATTFLNLDSYHTKIQFKY